MGARANYAVPLGRRGRGDPVPSLSPTLLATHLAWGVPLDALVTWGYEHVTPWLAHLGGRLAGRFERAGPSD